MVYDLEIKNIAQYPSIYLKDKKRTASHLIKMLFLKNKHYICKLFITSIAWSAQKAVEISDFRFF